MVFDVLNKLMKPVTKKCTVLSGLGIKKHKRGTMLLKFWLAFIAFFYPYGKDLEFDIMQRVNISISICYIGAAFIAFNAYIEFGSGLYVIGSIDIIAICCFIVLSLLFKYRMISVTWLYNLVFTILFINTYFSAFYAGGAITINILWVIMLPLLAQLLLPERSSKIWFVIIMVSMIVLFILNLNNFDFPLKPGINSSTVSSEGHFEDRLSALIGFMFSVFMFALLFRAGIDDSIDQMKDAKEQTEKVSDNLNQALNDIKDNSLQLTRSSIDLADSGKKLEQNAATTIAKTASVYESSKSIKEKMDQMESQISEADVRMDKIANIAEHAKTVGEKGGAIAQKTFELMEDLRKRGKDSIDITNVIQKTANSLKLLALNAGIEAANAKIHGQDFKIVAEQVKNLANQTAKATSDIYRILKTLQDTTDGSMHYVLNLVDIVKTILDFQHSIASAVEEQQKSTKNISRHLSETASISAFIIDSINEVVTASENTQQEVQKTYSETTSLTKMSESLSSLIEISSEQAGEKHGA